MELYTPTLWQKRQSKASVIKGVLSIYFRSPKRALLLTLVFLSVLLLIIQLLRTVFWPKEFIYQCYEDYGYPLNKTVVNSHPYRYITNASSTCAGVPEVLVITLVKSAAGNFKQRHYIRKTWGKDAKKKNLRLVFLLGHNKENQFMVEYENNMEGDIVQQDFHDNYYNNTIKVTMALNWVSTFCKNAKYIQIVDDDMFINFQNALGFLEDKRESGRFYLYAGYHIREPTPERSMESKWYISPTLYSFDCFPPYIAGGYVLMNSRTAAAFQKIIPYIPTLPFDDVYFGIVSQKLSIIPSHINTLDVSRPLTSREKVKCLIALHDYTTMEDFLHAYNITHNRFLEGR
ncbi:beta-1,3-galactosyltransferase brn-like isoform X2 [Ostrea edulis]|nr:beta-1,3-galactosyltransferase brn-like isoform X2 [Ostrea edulis]XP_048781090.1 beta-1,3-galactosyltransferase brn-like isoform X2 [Ostrea edulis]XP_048781091.1 beta-1,3-galactosyltransferase brn-like isoform X2 [Ostrea edulis]XP_055997447.1 beta-1,3-galactosyltransferase brn-like isoform X2 [Ostrea edulis]